MQLVSKGGRTTLGTRGSLAARFREMSGTAKADRQAGVRAKSGEYIRDVRGV